MKKKSSLKKRAKAAFWFAFVLGCLWIAFAPHTPHTPPAPPSVTVKVQQPSLQAEPPLTESPAPSAETPLSAGEEPSSPGAVSVPVVPEAHEPLPAGHPVKIAIVIDDMGADMKGSERAIQLPASVTLSFLPYAVRAREQAKDARERGHEILLHMPMEPLGREAPGEGALLVDLPVIEIKKRLETAMARVPDFDGVNNHMGSKFTANEGGMALVLDALNERHLFFLDSRTSGQTLGEKIAETKGMPALARDVFLDDDPSPEAIRKQLESAEHIARRKGFAVAIGHPHAATLDALETWLAEAPKRGIDIVPVNKLIVKK